MKNKFVGVILIIIAITLMIFGPAIINISPESVKVSMFILLLIVMGITLDLGLHCLKL